MPSKKKILFDKRCQWHKFKVVFKLEKCQILRTTMEKQNFQRLMDYSFRSPRPIMRHVGKNDASLTLLDDLCKSDKHLNLLSLFKSDHGSPNISLV